MHQFLKLRLHIVLDVSSKIGIFLFAGVVSRPVGSLGIGVMPVHYGVVETESDAVLFAGFGKLGEYVSLKRSGVHYVIVGNLRIPQAEAIVVFRGDDHVLHSGVFGDSSPLVSVKFYGIELPGKLLILSDGDLGIIHNPLADTADFLAFPFAGGNGIKSPVDKHAESRLAPPCHSFVVLAFGFAFSRSLGELSTTGEY